MVGVVAVVDFGADDPAAVQAPDQVQMEPAAHHDGRRVGHVPAPDRARRRGHVGGGRWAGAGGTAAKRGSLTTANSAAQHRAAFRDEVRGDLFNPTTILSLVAIFGAMAGRSAVT